MTWLWEWLQVDGLRQAHKRLNAEQVGINLRLLRQELVKGQHNLCSRHDALSVAPSGGFWGLWLACST